MFGITKRQVSKLLVMVGSAGLLMGNEKCEQQQPIAKPRSLKKIVELGNMKSSPFLIPSGGSFDFQFVANQQLYGEIAESGQFTVRNAPTISGDPSNPTNENPISLTPGDQKLLAKSMSEAKQSDFRAEFSRTAWCMVNLPQAKLGGSVNAFELIGGGGLSIGFNQNGNVGSGLGVGGDFDVEYAQLDVSMNALPPLGKSRLADVNINAKQTKTKVSFKINFGAFGVGPRYYYQTPLASVTKTALQKGVDSLATSMAKDKWYSRVFMDHDTHVTIVGGRDVNLEVGDRLRIYNEEYAWSGEPCNSQYLGSVGLGEDSYYATVEVVSVGDELSRVKVVEFAPNSMQRRAVVGGKVVLDKLHEEIEAAKKAASSATPAQTVAKAQKTKKN